VRLRVDPNGCPLERIDEHGLLERGKGVDV
jgi:hypothetical protein